LPTGAVTLLFSDIEGSTALLSRLGDRYREALSDHRVLLRAEFKAWRGHEISTEGDSFFVAFEAAADAVGCCLAAQRALAAHDWPGGDAVRVRMGLHSGEVTLLEGSYVGMDVHRAARIAATAHGGQVVLSEPALQRAGPLPEGASVRDLGFHRLKDIGAPERIYQLAAPGLREDFPALKSLGTQASLPVPATPLVGRDDDVERLRAVISRPGVRLVTLTGPGGVGKTRLSLAAAATLDHAFPHGVFFVALAAVRDVDVMWKTLAGDLDVDGDGPAAVLEYLRNRRMLLVLDNLEQLDGAGEIVAALAAEAPGLVVLATSRGPLYVQGEHQFPVPPLGVARGADVDKVAASAAVRLFAQQAAMVRPGFAITGDNAADVAAICRRLDGLPLAIELAASRVRLLAPRALLARLGESLGLATAEAGRPSRQQTLRNLVAWSYDLLTPGTAQVFRRMSVFAGGCDLDALDAVALPGDGDLDPLELVAGLHDVSLITVTEGPDGEPRLGMLETIREYALERLEADDDADGARGRHAGYYAGVAERAGEQLDGPAQLTVLDRLETDNDNLRAALAWSLETPAADPAGRGERTLIGLRLVQALTTFWYQHGHATEGRRWLQRAMDLASGDGGEPLARVAHGLGVLMDQQGEPDAARRLFERSLTIWRELGDRNEQARELNSLGIAYRHLGQLAPARAFLEEAVALNRETGDMVRLAASLANLGQLESSLGRWDRAMVVVQEALLLDRQYGSPFGVAVDQSTLALSTLRAGRPREARDLVCDMLDYVASSGNTAFFVNTLELAAVIVGALDDVPLAARLLGAARTVRRESGMQVTPPEAALLDELLAPARAAVTPQEWDAEEAVGRALSQPEALTLLRSLSPA
jgi:predicted ATPase/class 3 adenylate cyclase/Tfp pilus assembly protein PilF